jgi:fatty-acyl-CoA synthase
MSRQPILSGLMQQNALTVDQFLSFAAQWHRDTEVVARQVGGCSERSTYGEIASRARLLSGALLANGIQPGDRVATLAMNHIRHIEAWYGIMGIGAVCHTVNPRLFDEQIIYIINHAGDRILMADATFLPLVARILPHCPTIERILVIPDGSPETAAFATTDYDQFLVSAGDTQAPWGDFDESTACGLCYTSGTTGDPKGVLYSHRSNYLHALATLQHDFLNFSAQDVILPAVPMFHANAWGIAFSAPAAGSKLALPGARLDGASLHRLIEEEGVTFAAGVPTLWQGLLQHLEKTGGTLATVKRILIGGSACPPALMRALEDDYGVEVLHAWGMTETSPVATSNAQTRSTLSLPRETRNAQALKQGRPMFGLGLALKDEDGGILPHDGRTPGHLLIRGETVASGYFKGAASIVDKDGWFDTGDIATIDTHGFVQITDRAKDLIKSGGEWISSIEIENAMMSHPKIAVAAVVGMPHDRWGERPLLIVQLKMGESAEADEMLSHLQDKIAKWWMPDVVRFVDAIPLAATGKIDKKVIRATMVGAAA